MIVFLSRPHDHAAFFLPYGLRPLPSILAYLQRMAKRGLSGRGDGARATPTMGRPPAFALNPSACRPMTPESIRLGGGERLFFFAPGARPASAHACLPSGVAACCCLESGLVSQRQRCPPPPRLPFPLPVARALTAAFGRVGALDALHAATRLFGVRRSRT